MSNQDMWALIIGFIMPAAIAFIQREKWSTSARALCAFVVCAIAAAVQVYIQASVAWSWTDWVTDSLLILVTAISTYNHWWKHEPLKIVPRLESISGGRRLATRK